MSDETNTGAAPAVSEVPASNPPAAPSAPEPSATRGQETAAAINRALRSGLGTTEAAPSTPPAKDASPKPDAGTEPEWQPPKTKAELDRIVQAETDRRENKRKIEAEARAKKEQERWELDNNPQAVIDRRRQEIAEEETQAQQQEASSRFVAKVQDDYDRAVLDPLVLALPESVQAKILKDNPFTGDVIEHRKAIALATLAAIKKQAKAEGAAEAEAKLRRNPALIKQSLVDLRDESDNEPVAVAGANVRPLPDVNSWLRGA